MQFNKLTLRTNLNGKQLFSVVLALLLIGLGSVIVAKMIEKRFQQTLQQSLNSILNNKIEAVRLWAREQRYTAEGLAKDEFVIKAAQQLLAVNRDKPQLLESPTQQQLRLEIQPYLDSGQYMGYFLIAPDNINLASSRDSNIGIENLLTQQAEVLARLWDGKTLLTPIQSSDVLLTGDERSAQPGNETMFVGTPIKNNAGNIIALLTLRINPYETLFPLVSGGVPGESGESYIIDHNGVMLTKSRFESELVRMGLLRPGQSSATNIRVLDPGMDLTRQDDKDGHTGQLPLTRMASSLTNQEDGSDLQGYRDYRGVPVIGVWHWDNELGIGLAVEQDVSEAYALYDFVRLLIYAGAMVTALVLLALVAVFAWGKRQTQQIKARLQAIVETANDGIVVIDDHGIIESINPAVEELFGYTSKELIGNNISMLMPEPYHSEHDGYLQRYRDTGEARIIGGSREAEGRRADGSTIPIELSINRLELDTGLHFAGVIHDNTERKQAESILAEERDFTHQVLNSLSAHIAVLDESGRIILVNRAWEKFAENNGLSTEEAGVGINYLEVTERAAETDSDDEAKVISSQLQKMLAGNLDTFTLEYPCHSPQQKRWFEMRTKRFHYQDRPIVVISHLDITKRVVFEQQLRAANNELRIMSLVAKTTKNAVIVTNTDGIITWVNEGFTAISGYDLNEVKGRKPGDILQGPDTDADIVAKISAALKAEKTVEGEILNYSKSGKPYWIYFEINPVYDENHNLMEFVALEQDITEEKQLLVELQNERDIAANANKMLKLTQQALDYTGIAEFWVSARDGHVIRVNDQACRHLGYSREELLALSVPDFDPFYTKDEYAERVTPVVQQGWGRFETVHLTKDRRRIPVEITAMYLPQSEEKEAMFITFVTDITERKQAEEELHTSKERLEAAASAGIIGIWDWDVVNNRLYWDDVMYRLYGIREEDFDGAYEAWSSTIHPEDRKRVEKDITAALRGERDYSPEFRVVWPDGSTHHIKAASRTIFDDQDKPVRMIGVNYDLTEQKQAEKALILSREEAEAANRAKSTFLATMSHEIRTPLNGVVGTLELLEHSKLEQQQLDLINTAQDSAVLLQGIIDDILDFSKIEAGKLELEQVPLTLEHMLEKFGENMQPLASKRDVELLTYCDPRLPEVQGDPVRLRQILYNLVGNAIKFSGDLEDRAGQVVVKVIMEGQSNGRVDIRFQIKDNGVGMSTEVQHRLFSPFVQGESETTRRFGGTGLGLVITRRLAEMMDGYMEMDSVEGQGTTFSVFLSLELASPAPVEEISNLEGIFILLVSNSDETAWILKEYLGHAGADVMQVGFDEALDRCRTVCDGTRDSVVMIDIHADEGKAMPLRDALRREIRETELRFVMLVRGPHLHTGLKEEDGMTLNLNVIHRGKLQNAVAAVTGRESPQQDVESQMEFFTAASRSIDKTWDSGLRILLAEDNETNQKVISQQLDMLGISVDVAENGKQALTMLQDGSYDLLMTDCHMPELDGYQLTEKFREQEDSGDHLPIIAITADAMKGTAQKCFASGMDDFLSKPIQLQRLGETLSKWLPSLSRVSADDMEQITPQKNAPQEVIDPFALGDLLNTQDQKVLADYYSDFLRSSDATIEQIRIAYHEDDLTAVASLAHKLKSSARTVGANGLADCCQAIETAVKEGDLQNMSQNMTRFQSMFEKVTVWIKNYCEAA